MSDSTAGSSTIGSTTTTTHMRLIVAVLAIGIVIFSMVQSATSPILATLVRELHTTQGMVTWVLTAYLLSAAVCTPILGRVGDMVGKERVFVIILLVFGVGSAVCAAAPNIGVMILGRAIQGIGGAVVPLSFGIVRDELPKAKVASTVGLLAALLGAGGGIAVVVAGPVVSLLGYRWLFWIPLIVVVTAAGLGHRYLPHTHVRQSGGINWRGAVLLSAWLVALLLGVSKAPRWGWGSSKVLGLIAFAIVTLIAWVIVESRSKNPVIDMQMMRLPVVWRMNLVALLYGAGLYANFAFFPQYVQSPTSTGYGFGASVTESGLLQLPAPGLMFVFGTLATPLTRRIGARYVVFIGSILSTGMYVMLALQIHALWSVLAASALLGAGYGLAFTTFSNVIVAGVRADQTGVANGMNTNIRTIGGAIGAAVISSVITGHVRADGYPFASSYRTGWLALVGVGLVATAVSLIIPTRRQQAEAQLVEPIAVGSVAPATDAATV